MMISKIRFALWFLTISIWNYSFPLALWWEDVFFSVLLSLCFLYGYERA